MGDLKPLWPNPPLGDHDLAGDSIVSSGSDPNASGGDGPAGLKPIWTEKQIVPTPSGEETANSSGLPPRPNRFEPSESSAEPPDLTDRNPGTIDRK